MAAGRDGGKASGGRPDGEHEPDDARWWDADEPPIDEEDTDLEPGRQAVAGAPWGRMDTLDPDAHAVTDLDEDTSVEALPWFARSRGGAEPAATTGAVEPSAPTASAARASRPSPTPRSLTLTRPFPTPPPVPDRVVDDDLEWEDLDAAISRLR